jgi:hypothetical protein
MKYRVTAGIFAVLFLAGAAVQVNDPDPAGWMAVYALSAVTAGLAAARVRAAIYPAACLALAAVVWGSWLGYEVVSQGLALFDETGREAMGLGIVAAFHVGVILGLGRPS